jgi:hypothetical protein
MLAAPIASTLAVTWRQYLVWRKLLRSSIATNVLNPILFLFAFGFGLGRFIESMQGVSYMAFVVPGMIGYAAMPPASRPPLAPSRVITCNATGTRFFRRR